MKAVKHGATVIVVMTEREAVKVEERLAESGKDLLPTFSKLLESLRGRS